MFGIIIHTLVVLKSSIRKQTKLALDEIHKNVLQSSPFSAYAILFMIILIKIRFGRKSSPYRQSYQQRQHREVHSMRNNQIETEGLPTSWQDIWKLEDPLDFDNFRDSNLPASRRHEIKVRVHCNQVSAIISFIASSCLSIHFLRSHERLFTTYHRVVFATSVSDMLLSSLAYALSTAMVPQELGYYAPNAGGSMVSCTFQGFFIRYMIAVLYNCSM